jgi:hypothetical protein
MSDGMRPSRLPVQPIAGMPEAERTKGLPGVESASEAANRADGNQRAVSRIRVLQPDGTIIRPGAGDVHPSTTGWFLLGRSPDGMEPGKERSRYTHSSAAFDVVDQASFDSFPASDPPPWWGGARVDTVSERTADERSS